MRAKNAEAELEYSIGEQSESERREIAELIGRAFSADRTWGDRRTIVEPYIPALLSCGAESARALSLVARDGLGRALGCAIWYPYKTSIAAIKLDAWCLAPLAVDPEVAGKGLGGALMRNSLATLESNGARMAFLLGHEGYYPRFGFRTGMFGSVGISPKWQASQRASLEERDFELRAPRPSDEAALRKMWAFCFAGVDLALEPEPGFLPWLAWSPGTHAVVLESGGGARAYARYRAAQGESAAKDFLVFLADGPDSAEALVDALAREGERPSIPLHPRSAAAALLFPAGYDALCDTYKAAMVLPLGPQGDPRTEAVESYCDEVAAGARMPGLPLFPAIFDPDDMGA